MLPTISALSSRDRAGARSDDGGGGGGGGVELGAGARGAAAAAARARGGKAVNTWLHRVHWTGEPPGERRLSSSS
jgi:hypothetical protein